MTIFWPTSTCWNTWISARKFNPLNKNRAWSSKRSKVLRMSMKRVSNKGTKKMWNKAVKWKNSSLINHICRIDDWLSNTILIFLHLLIEEIVFGFASWEISLENQWAPSASMALLPSPSPKSAPLLLLEGLPLPMAWRRKSDWPPLSINQGSSQMPSWVWKSESSTW